MVAKKDSKRRRMRTRTVRSFLVHFWVETLAVVFLLVGVFLIVYSEKTTEETALCGPLLARAEAFAENGDKRRAFFSYAVASVFLACPDEANDAMADLREQLDVTEHGWGHVSEVPYRGKCRPFHIGPLPDEQPSIEPRILADPRLVGDGEFQGLSFRFGSAVTPLRAPDGSLNTYLAALRADILRFVARPDMTLEEVEATYGKPVVIQEGAESSSIVRYGRIALILNEQDEVVEVLRWLRPSEHMTR